MWMYATVVVTAGSYIVVIRLIGYHMYKYHSLWWFSKSYEHIMRHHQLSANYCVIYCARFLAYQRRTGTWNYSSKKCHDVCFIQLLYSPVFISSSVDPSLLVQNTRTSMLENLSTKHHLQLQVQPIELNFTGDCGGLFDVPSILPMLNAFIIHDHRENDAYHSNPSSLIIQDQRIAQITSPTSLLVLGCHQQCT